jgi:HK97 family phage major capsid protein/HK97 family phage prohead protease
MKLPVQFRTYELRAPEGNDSRIMPLSFSSEEPYERSFGIEVLDHQPASVDLSRLNDGAPLLVNHDTDKQVGVVEAAEVADKTGRAKVRFGKSAYAEEIFRDVQDGIRRKVSVAYRVLKMVQEKAANAEAEVYRVTRWQPLEVSIVGIPADSTVGVGRAEELKRENEVEVETVVEVAQVAEAASPVEAAKETAVEPEAKSNTETHPQVTVKEHKTMPENTDPVVAERARVAELLAIGEQISWQAEARKAIAEGTSVADFQRHAFQHKFKATPAPSMEIGMSNREVEQWTLLGGIKQLAEKGHVSGLHKEASDAVAKKTGKDSRGFFIPEDVMKRDVVQGTTTLGGFAINNEMRGPMIEALVNAMIVKQCGATILTGLPPCHQLLIPRLASLQQSYWVNESGAVTEGNWTLAQVALQPKTVGAWQDISRQAIIQSMFPLEGLVRDSLMESVAGAIDLAAFYGNALGTTTLASEPIGLLNNTTITRRALGTTDLGDVPTYADMIGMQTTVGSANGRRVNGKMAYVTNDSIRGLLKTTPSSTAIAGLGFIAQTIDGKDYIDGLPLHVTNAVPSNIALPSTTLGAVGAGILFGDFTQLLVAFFSGMDIRLDACTGSASDTLRILAFQDVDVAPRQPASFVRVTDAKAATT